MAKFYYLSSEAWKEIESKKDKDHIFIYTIRHPDKNNLDRWELKVSEYLYTLYDDPLSIKSSKYKKADEICYLIKELYSNDENIIRVKSKPEGKVYHNSIWFFGKLMQDHYNDAIEAFIADKNRLRDDYQRKFEIAMKTNESMLKFLSDAKM